MSPLLLLLSGAPASAVEPGTYLSEPREVVLADSFDAFEAITFDTGSLPAGSPLAVRFSLTSRGGSYAEMEAWSEVSWPEALTHELVGVPGSGFFELICDLDLSADVTYDLWGFRGGVSVWSATLELDDAATFDPLLLPDGTPERVDLSVDGGGLESFQVDIPLVAGLELRFLVDVFPRVRGILAGSRVEVNDQALETALGTTLHDLPQADPGVLPLDLTYVADLRSALEVVIRPQLEVCAPVLGCFRVARFDVPIPLLDESVERAFASVSVDHPLPVLAPPVTTHDFGEVPVDTLANLQLPLENLGRLDLEGTLAIEGSQAFSVFPETFQAGEGIADGAVVTFAPSAEGPDSAVLVITSNDPAAAELRIPLAGMGWVEPPPASDDGEPSGRVSGEVGCGCAAADPAGAGGLLGLLALGLLIRRRR
jgi:MYXO-CTERM domain-containing protein